jgi:hypothetical protein
MNNGIPEFYHGASYNCEVLTFDLYINHANFEVNLWIFPPLSEEKRTSAKPLVTQDM